MLIFLGEGNAVQARDDRDQRADAEAGLERRFGHGSGAELAREAPFLDKLLQSRGEGGCDRPAWQAVEVNLREFRRLGHGLRNVVNNHRNVEDEAIHVTLRGPTRGRVLGSNGAEK